jgi:hypothetical protein
MTQDEIMQLAKDAGLRIDVRGTYFFVGFVELSDLLDAAITKEREALAQEQEPVATLAVRWRNPVGKVAYVLEVDLPTGIHKLYTHPPQRTWMGLTSEEVANYWDWEDFQCGCGRGTLLEMVRDIEAKLKERNT